MGHIDYRQGAMPCFQMIAKCYVIVHILHKYASNYITKSNSFVKKETRTRPDDAAEKQHKAGLSAAM